MTALANSPVFWIGLLAGLAALYVLPTIGPPSRATSRAGLADGPCPTRL
jgi:hypothetical protein